jgi:predicted Fe-Mo cluster-binding NifX family protein
MSIILIWIIRTEFMKLNTRGITVYRAGAGTITENLGLLKENRLTVFTLDEVCAGHGHGCSH